MFRIGFNEMDTFGKIGTVTSVASGIATLASAIIDVKDSMTKPNDDITENIVVDASTVFEPEI